jgi:UDP-perosamine 4-acetyltransferase
MVVKPKDDEINSDKSMSSGKKTLLISAGGQARVVASILGYDLKFDIVGVLDSQKSSIGEKVNEFKVVGTYDDLERLVEEGIETLALCMGDNKERHRWYLKAKKMGLDIASVIHPTAFIETDVYLGEGVVICAGAIICSQVKIGNGVIVNTGSIIDHETYLHDFCSVAPGSKLAGRVVIGKKTFIGIGVTISNNIKIGDEVVIGAGSVVVNNIETGATAYGVPAISKKEN